MLPNIPSDDQEKLLASALELYSISKLEALLSTSREHLKFLAGHAGALYKPFEKKDRTRPFAKKAQASKKKPRIIDNPLDQLKVVQKEINRQLLKSVIFPDYILGGVHRKRVLDNVMLHLGAPVLVTLDIKSFFRRITNIQVYGVWRDVLDCSPKIATLLTRLTTFERHLPQGAPTSSLLANLVLHSCDFSIRDECRRRGVMYSTWVDDLAFSGREARGVISVAVHALTDAGFAVSHRKLRVMGPATRKVLNGVLLSRFPSVVPEYLRRIRSGIHKLQTGLVPPHDSDRYLRILLGAINHISSIEPKKGAQLRNRLETIMPRNSVR
jgi:Reverse transcriptase (RNA-dependent DNA polymerase)